MPIFLPKEPSRKELLMTAVLYALSDEIRLGIVRQLAAKGEQPCGVFEVDRPKSSLSHHFRVLRESGVVATRKDGKGSDEYAAARGSGGSVSGVVEGCFEGVGVLVAGGSGREAYFSAAGRDEKLVSNVTLQA